MTTRVSHYKTRGLRDLAKVDLLYFTHALKRRGLFDIVENEMSNKAKLRANDLVRVVQTNGKPGPTLYMIEWIGERGYCVIREAGKPLAGGQEFDLSCLVKASRDPAPRRKMTPLDALFGDC